MTARKVSSVVLAVAAWLVCARGQPAVQPRVGNQKAGRAAQEKGGPQVVGWKVDDDLVRVQLLARETVQRDLGMSAEQLKVVQDFAKLVNDRTRGMPAKFREIFPAPRRYPPEEYETRMRKYQAWVEEVNAKDKQSRAEILAMLTPSQSARLEQIRLQAAIPGALARPDIIKALDISEEQGAKIRALSDEMAEKVLARRPDLRGLDAQACRERILAFDKESGEVQAETAKRVLDVLAAEQRTKFEKLQGKKIDLTQLSNALTPEDAAVMQELWTMDLPEKQSPPGNGRDKRE